MAQKKKLSAPSFFQNFDRWHGIFLVFCVLFAGLLVGILLSDMQVMRSFNDTAKIVRVGDQTFVAVQNLSEDFLLELGKENELAVYGGRAWIPVEGLPVELIVVNDATCGEVCAPDQAVGMLRQALTPALLVRNTDINSPEGKALQEKFSLNSVPAYVLGSSVENLERDGKKVLDQLASVLTPNDGQYLIRSEQVGFPVGKYLSAPEIDLEGEPTLGNGTVQVVEFTDFQCPFCKRLHDENKDLIARLVEEGTIRYVAKDFPLEFHKEALPLHVVASCVQKFAGSQAYFALRGEFFDRQSEWSGKGVQAAQAFGMEVAQQFHSNTEELSACVADESVLQEITEDMAEGRGLGVSGTPTLFIGTQRMPGAISADMFERAVESEE